MHTPQDIQRSNIRPPRGRVCSLFAKEVCKHKEDASCSYPIPIYSQHATATQCCNTPKQTCYCNAKQYEALQRTTTHLNTLQHIATHCNTLQHIATHCNTLQHTATHCMWCYHKLSAVNVYACALRHFLYMHVRWSTFHCVAVCCSALQYISSDVCVLIIKSQSYYLKTMQFPMCLCHCNTLQHIATSCNMQQLLWGGYD